MGLIFIGQSVTGLLISGTQQKQSCPVSGLVQVWCGLLRVHGDRITSTSCCLSLSHQELSADHPFIRSAAWYHVTQTSAHTHIDLCMSSCCNFSYMSCITSDLAVISERVWERERGRGERCWVCVGAADLVVITTEQRQSEGGHLVFIRVISLSKFRSWRTDCFSSNTTAAVWFQPLHTQTETELHSTLKAEERRVASQRERSAEAGEEFLQTKLCDIRRHRCRGRERHKLDYSASISSAHHSISALTLLQLDNDRGSRGGSQPVSSLQVCAADATFSTRCDLPRQVKGERLQPSTPTLKWLTELWMTSVTVRTVHRNLLQELFCESGNLYCKQKMTMCKICNSFFKLGINLMSQGKQIIEVQQ